MKSMRKDSVKQMCHCDIFPAIFSTQVHRSMHMCCVTGWSFPMCDYLPCEMKKKLNKLISLMNGNCCQHLQQKLQLLDMNWHFPINVWLPKLIKLSSLKLMERLSFKSSFKHSLTPCTKWINLKSRRFHSSRLIGEKGNKFIARLPSFHTLPNF